MPDEIQIEFLDDGRVKITTDEISTGSHRSADDAVKELMGLMGGDVIRQKNPRGRAKANPRQRVRN